MKRKKFNERTDSQCSLCRNVLGNRVLSRNDWQDGSCAWRIPFLGGCCSSLSPGLEGGKESDLMPISWCLLHIIYVSEGVGVAMERKNLLDRMPHQGRRRRRFSNGPFEKDSLFNELPFKFCSWYADHTGTNGIR